MKVLFAHAQRIVQPLYHCDFARDYSINFGLLVASRDGALISLNAFHNNLRNECAQKLI